MRRRFLLFTAGGKKKDQNALIPWKPVVLSNYYDERTKAAEGNGDDPVWGCLMKKDEDMDGYRKMSDMYQQMENEHDEEDTAMLIRLVKVRHSLWT